MRSEQGGSTSIRGARLALWTAVAAVLLLGASGPLYQLEFLSRPAAYNGVRLAVGVASIAAVSAAAALWTGFRTRSNRRLAVGALALAIALFTVIVPVREVLRDRAAPPLHDITTDLRNPPTFKALLEVQGASSRLPRPAETDALQTRAYPDIAPLMLPVEPDMAFEEVLETLAELDWPVADGDHHEGLIEATVRSAWFGIRDDIVVRLTPVGGQTRVDVRSVARDGLDDGGRNAEHVREFLDELQR